MSRPFIAVLGPESGPPAEIAAAAQAAGVRVTAAADPAALWETIEQWPELILVDLAVDGWAEAVRRAKTLPHTRMIPIVAFGEADDPASLHAARAAGCDQALPRPRLSAALPDLLRATLHPPVRHVAGCAEPPPPALRRGIEQFNAGAYWECHETLEDLWNAEPRAVRDLYQGILQVGVALHHLRQGNYAGAIKLFRRGLPRLRGFPPVCQGVPVHEFVAAARAVHDAAVGLGPARLDRLELPFPRIDLREPA
ncbi:MAG: hypothetical protein BWY52_02614 [Chloroflexi bacterium ADurb.Bin325]|nr:MAG: hypothetical protein BWY52_02614 [Chloroflexi bacterium ADurb.Bin325]